MEKPIMEWINKIFNCLSIFYGERWTKLYSKPEYESIAKEVWQSALTGCDYDEIRDVLVYLKRAAQNPSSLPPHQLDFFHYAKKNKFPYIDYAAKTDSLCNPEVSKLYIAKIKDNLKYKNMR